jgi:hypothetical protein
MASSTPITSPVSQTMASRAETPPRPSSTKPTQSKPGCKTNLGSKKQETQISSPPRTPSHSRNVSGSSIRTAIRLPRTLSLSKEQEKLKMRKDSISLPRPLGSPFSVERSASVSRDPRQADEHDPRDGYAYGVGEAI